MNAASCSDGVAAFSCSCQAGYTGVLCETGNARLVILGYSVRQVVYMLVILGYSVRQVI